MKRNLSSRKEKSEDKKFKQRMGKKIEKARKALGLSYGELAKKTKVKSYRLIRFEKGEVKMTILMLFKLAKALRVEAKDLLCDD